jgi:Lipocalin-like domain
MKKINFLICATAFMLLLSSTSCKKEVVTPTPVIKSQTELLLHNGNSWKISAAIVDPAFPYKGTLISNYFDQMTDCEKDDNYLYSANPITATSGSVILKNPTKCESTELVQYLGIWEISGDNLITTFGSNSSSEALVELTETKLVTKSKITSNGVNYTVTWTYQ